MTIINISSGEISMKAELFDTPTARAIEEVLPIEGEVNVWGEEIYFTIPVTIKQEPDAREEVEVGELGYWPVGKAFCVFFGPTPVSTGEKPRAYSPVNILGCVLGDATQFRAVRNGNTVRIEQIE